MLLPITFALPPVSALIMLAGIYYGAQYGGSTTAILINLPGESSSVVTAIDGYQMAQQGPRRRGARHRRARLVLRRHRRHVRRRLLAPPLAEVALKFGPAEYFSLMVLGLVASVVLAQRLAAQGARHDRARACCSAWSAPTSTPARRASPSTCPSSPTASTSSRRHGRVRPRRDHRATSSNEHTRQVCVTAVSAALMPTREDWKRMVGADPARHRPGLGARHPAGRRRDAGLVRRLHPGEEGLAATRAEFGKGAIEGVAGTGIGQQRRRADLVHPDADARHPVQPGHGADDRRDDHPGHPARAQRDDRTAGAVLGHDRLDVGRQPDAGGAQPAADRHVGQAADHPLPAALPGDPRVLLRSACYSLNNACFDVYHDGHLRPARLRCWSSSTASRRRCCSASSSGR